MVFRMGAPFKTREKALRWVQRMKRKGDTYRITKKKSKYPYYASIWDKYDY